MATATSGLGVNEWREKNSEKDNAETQSARGSESSGMGRIGIRPRQLSQVAGLN